MEIVIEQSQLKEERITYQEQVPYYLKCRKCKNDYELLLMQVHDIDGELVPQRPEMVLDGPCRVWPHDSSVVSVYLCTHCGSMRARWNQG